MDCCQTCRKYNSPITSLVIAVKTDIFKIYYSKFMLYKTRKLYSQIDWNIIKLTADVDQVPIWRVRRNINLWVQFLVLSWHKFTIIWLSTNRMNLLTDNFLWSILGVLSICLYGFSKYGPLTITRQHSTAKPGIVGLLFSKLKMCAEGRGCFKPNKPMIQADTALSEDQWSGLFVDLMTTNSKYGWMIIYILGGAFTSCFQFLFPARNTFDKCDTVRCAWPKCSDDEQPVTKPGDCCPSCRK